jgi:hypothetical protein
MAVIGQDDSVQLEIALRSASHHHHLGEWQVTMPDHMQGARGNMARYASEGLGRTFVALHIEHFHLESRPP